MFRRLILSVFLLCATSITVRAANLESDGTGFPISAAVDLSTKQADVITSDSFALRVTAAVLAISAMTHDELDADADYATVLTSLFSGNPPRAAVQGLANGASEQGGIFINLDTGPALITSGQLWSSSGGIRVDGGSPIVLQGATVNAYSTTLAADDPTTTRTIHVPNASGVMAVTASSPLSLSATGALTLSTSSLFNGFSSGSAASAGASEASIKSTTISANTLATAGDSLKVDVYGTFLGNGLAKQIRVRLGSEFILTAPTRSGAAGTWHLSMTIQMVGTGSQKAFIETDTYPPDLFLGNPMQIINLTMDETAANDLIIYGRGGSSGGVTVEFWKGGKVPA